MKESHHHGILQSMPPSKPGRRKRLRADPRKKPAAGIIPGWSRIHEIVIPDGAQRKSGATDPHKIIKTLVYALWHQAGCIVVKRMYPDACDGKTLCRALWVWLPDYQDKRSPLREIWRGYLAFLTVHQRGRWRKRLMVQAASWQDWFTAWRLSSRVHSPWFHAILDETIKRR